MPKPKTKTARQAKRPVTAKEIDEVVSNVTDQLIVAPIRDELRAGGVRRNKKRR
jgi:hypothetical protein